MFQELANFVVKRHKVIIIFWLILLVISLPATQLVSDVVVYEETSMAPEDIESAKAAELISDQFPAGIANSTALIVVQSVDVFSSRIRDFNLQLEDEVRQGDIDYLDNFTSIYSISRDYLLGTVPLVYPLVSETEGQVTECLLDIRRSRLLCVLLGEQSCERLGLRNELGQLFDVCAKLIIPPPPLQLLLSLLADME